MIRTKSVQEPAEAKDGLRILVARFRGRGLPAGAYDAWMPNLGPTEELLGEILSGAIAWSEFGRRYKKELFENGAIDERSKTIKNHGQKFTLRLLQELGRRGTVTLICHCHDTDNCHRFVLKKLLDQPI